MAKIIFTFADPKKRVFYYIKSLYANNFTISTKRKSQNNQEE